MPVKATLPDVARVARPFQLAPRGSSAREAWAVLPAPWQLPAGAPAPLPPVPAYAEQLIAAAGPGVPRYGSAEWAALPDGDRRKVAAIVVAAESWRTDLADLPFRLALQLQADKRAEDQAYLDRWKAHRSQWQDQRPGPRRGMSYAEAMREDGDAA